jgi:hypothetical protein
MDTSRVLKQVSVHTGDRLLVLPARFASKAPRPDIWLVPGIDAVGVLCALPYLPAGSLVSYLAVHPGYVHLRTATLGCSATPADLEVTVNSV